MTLMKAAEKIPTKTLSNLYTFAFWCSVFYSAVGIIWMFFMMWGVGSHITETYLKDIFDFTKYKSW
jgi:hypothetical protein